jgi:hypothetical protein
VRKGWYGLYKLFLPLGGHYYIIFGVYFYGDNFFLAGDIFIRLIDRAFFLLKKEE